MTRPPSVETRARGRPPGRRRARSRAVLAVARDVVAEERARLAGGADRGPRAAGRGCRARLEAFDGGGRLRFIRGWARARHQRHRRAAPHEPGARRLAAGRDRGRRARRGRPQPAGAGPRDRPARRPVPGARRSTSWRSPARRTRWSRTTTPRRSRSRSGLAGRRWRGRGVARRARRDRRWRAHPGDRAAGRRPTHRGGDHEPDARRGLRASRSRTAARTVVLRVHPSNFRQAGFTEAPDPAELAALAHAHGAIVIDDLGSGALLDTAAFGLAHEPTPRERLAAGADLVTFSGDKLLGGPQAGLDRGPRGPRRPAPDATRWRARCGRTR